MFASALISNASHADELVSFCWELDGPSMVMGVGLGYASWWEEKGGSVTQFVGEKEGL